MRKIKLFVDSDGTLFEWKKEANLDSLVKPGYFANLYPQENVVKGIKIFKDKHPEVDVYIATCVLDYPHIIMDKKKAFKKHLPFMKQNHIIYIPYGISKADYIGDVDEACYLLDDHTPNLFDWEEHRGKSIKLKNGTNNTKNTWKKEFIHSDYPDWMVCECLENIIFEKGEK